MNILGTIVGTVLVVVGDAIKDYGTRLLFPHGVPRIDEPAKPESNVDTAEWGQLPGDNDDPNYGRECGRCGGAIRQGMRYVHVCDPLRQRAQAQDDLDEPPVGVPPVVLSDAAKEALIKGSMPAPKKPVTPEPVLKGSLKDRLAR